MKRIFLPTLLFLAVFCNSQVIDSAWLSKNYRKKETMIPMRDGVKLFTSIYSPKDTGKSSPILMLRTPYSVAPYGEKRYSPLLSASNFSDYVSRGYIIVMQDVRGAYMSEGTFVDIRPYIADKKTNKDVDEASDTYDAIDWLISNVKHTNGNVGVAGISYPGFYATMASLSGHPALKAVSPQAPVTDWFIGDDFHHNGAFALADAFNFFSGFGKPRPVPVMNRDKGYNVTEKDLYTFYLKQGALKNYKKLIGDSIRFWNDLMAHPNYDEWWKARDARRHVGDVQPAMLVVGGLFDAEDCFGAWNLYRALDPVKYRDKTYLAMGPWMHGGWHRSEGSSLGNVRFGSKTSFYYHKNIEVPFFTKYLSGNEAEGDLRRVSVFYSGENDWHQGGEWPPQNLDPRPVYLTADHGISYKQPEEKSSFSTYTSNPNNPVPYAENTAAKRITREYMTDDQRFAAKRPDVLVFQTEPLQQELRLAGPILANLLVKLSSTDADFVVKLIDVFPDNFKYETSYCCKGANPEAKMGGYQMMVRGEIIRGKFRNSFEKPEPFDTTKIETVRFLLPDIAHVFKPGHRLMIQIQSSWFPLFDMNPQQFLDIYSCEDKDFVPSKINVYHQADAASFIVLPVLKGR